MPKDGAGFGEERRFVTITSFAILLQLRHVMVILKHMVCGPNESSS